jgi:hypothetical protein
MNITQRVNRYEEDFMRSMRFPKTFQMTMTTTITSETTDDKNPFNLPIRVQDFHQKTNPLFNNTLHERYRAI